MNIAFVLYEHLLATSVVLPAEMLKAAGDVALAHGRRPPPRIAFVADNSRPFASRSGLPLQPSCGLDGQLYDLVILPALWRNPQPVVARHPALLPWLRRQHENGALVGAAGTGVCFLAASGLLNQRPATTHWFYLDAFAAQYPAVDLKRQYLITRSGNLFCAATINALADLTVHFIRHFYDNRVAAHVERHFSQEARQPYDNITYREEDAEHHHDEDIIRIQLWLRQHHPQTLRLAAVARQFGMSLRNFNRRFLAATGQTPLHYLQGIRIEQGRVLLGQSNLSIAEVAEKVGYQDCSHFTRLFRQTLGVTPQDYRKTVRSKVFAVEMPVTPAGKSLAASARPT